MNLTISKIFIALSLFVAIVFCSPIHDDNDSSENDHWSNFKKKFSKNYKNSADEIKRKENWKLRKQLIDSHNDKNRSFTLSENFFMDYVSTH